MTSKPLITIGITCHSEGDWLLECWQSVLDQTDDRWVAVLVMDGTTHEKTRDVFHRLKHPKLRKCGLLENIGPYPTRNTAFALTETPYHLYLDADDLLFPDTIATVLDVFTRHPGAGFVYGDYACFGSRSEVWRFPASVTHDDFLEGQPMPGGCAYRTDVWEQLGGFCEELARGNADYDFMIGAAEAGIQGRHCGKLFYRYRIGHNSKVSSSYRLRYHETHELMVRRHPVFFRGRTSRRRFLGKGYAVAAEANAAMGNRLQALRLAVKALGYGTWRASAFSEFACRQVLPTKAIDTLRYLKKTFRRAASGSSS